MKQCATFLINSVTTIQKSLPLKHTSVAVPLSLSLCFSLSSNIHAVILQTVIVKTLSDIFLAMCSLLLVYALVHSGHIYLCNKYSHAPFSAHNLP